MLFNTVSETEMTALPCATCHFICNLLSAITCVLNYLLNQTYLELVHFWLFPLRYAEAHYFQVYFLSCVGSSLHIISVF